MNTKNYLVYRIALAFNRKYNQDLFSTDELTDIYIKSDKKELIRIYDKVKRYIY